MPTPGIKSDGDSDNGVHFTLFSWTASGDLVRRPPTLDAPWHAQALAADPRVAFLPTQAQTMIAVATGNVVSLVATLHDPVSGARLGAVRVDLDARAVAGVVQRVTLGTQGHLLGSRSSNHAKELRPLVRHPAGA